MRIFSKVIAAILFGALASIVASPLAATFIDGGRSNYVFLAIFGFTLLAVLLAPTGRRAWGRGSLITGALLVSLPLFVTGLSAKVGSEMLESAQVGDETTTAIGATLGGGLTVGASAFLGFILGGVFLILGLILVLGGRREVIVVNQKNAEH